MVVVVVVVAGLAAAGGGWGGGYSGGVSYGSMPGAKCLSPVHQIPALLAEKSKATVVVNK